jgi:hypothetical protein
LFAMHSRSVPLRPVMRALIAAATVQPNIACGNETGLMRPAFGESPLRQRFVKPLHRIVAETRVQHQIRAACDNMNGIDLQQSHALDHAHHITAARASLQRLEQSLGSQLQ